MTRIEELSKLLVEELNDFDKDIEKLEKINEELKTTKIKMDLSEYKSIIKEHQQQMGSYLNEIKGFEQRFNKKIEDAKIYPTWAVVVFIMVALFGVGSIILSFI